MAQPRGEAFRIINESKPKTLIAARLSVAAGWAVQLMMSTSACHIIPGRGRMPRR